MALLKQFCYCCSLRTGSIIIGCIGIFRAVFMILGATVLFSLIKVINMDVILAILKKVEPEIPQLLSFTTENKDDIDAIIEVYVDVIFAVVLVFFFFSLIIYILLIVGAVKSCRYLFIPFVTFETAMVMSTIVGLGSMADPGTDLNSDLAETVIHNLIEIGLTIYCIVAVCSHFQEIREVAGNKNRNYALAEINETAEEKSHFVEKKM